jgi:hypothetical protein
MFDLSEERLVELAKILRISNYESIGQGFISLELGTKEGLKTGYPQLRFSQFKDGYSLDVTIPSDTLGYDTSREITLEEMIILVRVTKKSTPNSWITKKLFKIVHQQLEEKQKEIRQALKLIS